MRRIFFIIVLLAITGGVWYFFFRPTSTPLPATQKGGYFPSSDIGGTPKGQVTDAQIPATITAPTVEASSPFTRITSQPIAGYTIFNKTRTITTPSTDPKQKPIVTTATDRFLRYVSRANGYVYEVKNTETPIQITDITIPNIYEAVFIDNNKTALLRFLRDDNRNIATYAVPIPDENPDGTRTQQQGTYLSENILSLDPSPDSLSLGQVALTKTGSSIQSVTRTKTTTLLPSTFKEWLINWAQPTTLYLQTKASANAEGFLYALNPGVPKLRRVLGNITGLTTSVSPSGTYVLYSQSANNSFTTYVLNTKTNTTTPLNLAILPEKCTWSGAEELFCAGNNTVASTTYPDSWYAGITHFSDKIYRINLTTNTFGVSYDNSGPSFDMVNLSLNEQDQLLYFIEKASGTLWSFRY